MFNRIISLLLLVCIGVASFATPTSASKDEVSADALVENLVSRFPDIVSETEKLEYGYIARSVEAESDLNSLVFLNGDGKYTMRVYSHPVKYIDESGQVQDISLDLLRTDKGYETKSNSIISFFPDRISEGVNLEFDEYVITFVPTFTASKNVQADYNDSLRSVYYQCDDNVSIEYSLTYSGYKENIHVEKYNGITDYSFKVYTNGLAVENDGESLNFVDSVGNARAYLGDIFVFSANDKTNTMGSITFDTIKEYNEYIVTIHIDDDYLRTAEYPLRIDPTVEVRYEYFGDGAIQDVTINQTATYSGTSGSLFVGRHSNGSLSRVLMRFPTLSMPVADPNEIDYVKVEIRDLMCQSNQDIEIECYAYNSSAPSWSESGTTTWSSVGSSYLGNKLDSHIVSYGKGNVSTDMHRYSFDITALGKEWVKKTQSPSKGIVFKASSNFETKNTTRYWYKTFSAYNRSDYKPSLTISYSNDDAVGNYYYEAHTLFLNTSFKGCINNTADIDVYRFVVPKAGYYRFETLGDTDTSSYLSMHIGNNITPTFLTYNDNYDYEYAGYNTRIYYRFNKGDVVYWSIGVGPTGKYGDYEAKITQATAYLFGYNYNGRPDVDAGELNTTIDAENQMNVLSSSGLKTIVSSSPDLFYEIDPSTDRYASNHELFVFNGHGDIEMAETNSTQKFYSDDIESKMFASNKIALWFSCYSAFSFKSNSLAEASVNAGADVALGYTEDVDDAGARLFSYHFVEAIGKGASFEEANKFATTIFANRYPTLSVKENNPIKNTYFGNIKTKLFHDLQFNYDEEIGKYFTANSVSPTITQDFVKEEINGVNLFVRNINGIPTNEIAIEVDGISIPQSVVFSQEDIDSVKALLKTESIANKTMNYLNLKQSENVISVAKRILKIGSSVGVYDIYTIRNTSGTGEYIKTIFVNVVNGNSYDGVAALENSVGNEISSISAYIKTNNSMLRNICEIQ